MKPKFKPFKKVPKFPKPSFKKMKTKVKMKGLGGVQDLDNDMM